MKSSISKIVIACIAMSLMIVYTININYKLPFLTMDELAFMGKMQGGLESRISFGRLSHVIGYGINNLIGFTNPDTINLTKRFITILVLFSSIVATLVHFKISYALSISIASIAMMAHQLDWQHNGMIAFFGGYNLFLAFFLFAVIIYERYEKNYALYFLSFSLAILSFTTEIFIIIAIVYIIANAIQQKDIKYLHGGPISGAVIFYLAVFLLQIIKIKWITPEGAYRDGGPGFLEYATGSISTATPNDIGSGALINLINSLPYFNHFKFDSSTEIQLALLIAACLLVIPMRMLAMELKFQTSNNQSLENIPSSAFLISICALALIPSLLLSMQPMKLEWILSGASRRYVFSLYQWISIVLIASIITKYWLSKKYKYIPPVVCMAAIIIVINSMPKNLNFANSYEDSLIKWRSINNSIINSSGEIVKLPLEWLRHPNIIPLEVSKQGHHLPYLVKMIAKEAYGKTVQFCYDENNVNLTFEEMLGKIDLDGFSIDEAGSRWTDGHVAKIIFNKEFKNGDIIELSIINAFGENSILPIVYEFGDYVETSKFSESNKVRLKFTDKLIAPVLTIYIPKPQSPFQLHQGDDIRKLGIMINNIRVGKYINEQFIYGISEECF